MILRNLWPGSENKNMDVILKGKLLWSYEYEINDRDRGRDYLAHLTGVLPFHMHQGEIILSKQGLQVLGDINLSINASELDNIYLGFDEIFVPTLVKNFGLLWQPLRIGFTQGGRHCSVYLIIDFNFFTTKNKLWYETIAEVFSVQ
jgi:hypothetical protein